MSFKIERNKLSIRESHHFAPLSSTESWEEDVVKIQSTDPFLPNESHKILVFPFYLILYVHISDTGYFYTVV